VCIVGQQVADTMDYSDAFDSGSDLTAEDAEDNYDLDAYNPTGYESANLRVFYLYLFFYPCIFSLSSHFL
tara:strand:+ start:183 stop:392 length:210 start_codon:yes stop_codon:yes gene_type:complete